MNNNLPVSIPGTFRVHEAANTGKPMMIVDGETMSYGEFIGKTDRMAAVLTACGAGPGDCVAIAMQNAVDWYIVFWAAVQIGARPVPLDPQMGAWELKQLFSLMKFTVCCITRSYRANPLKKNVAEVLENLGSPPTVIVMDNGPVAEPFIALADALNRVAEEVAVPVPESALPGELLMYACTSGTTGNPKILAVEHAGFYQSQYDMATYLGLGPSDTMLLGMPLYHQGGFGMGVQTLLAGGTVIYQSQFNPDAFLRTIIEQRVTVVQLTATLAKILLSHPEFKHPAVESVRMAYFAGEALPDEVAERFYEDLGIRVVNIIGSSETGTMAVWDSQYDTDCGVNDFRPMTFTEIELHDAAGNEPPPGEAGVLVVRTDAVLLEYFGNKSLSQEKIILRDGKRWFDTGDCGMRLPDGRIRLMGRKKRIIKRGGNLVFPEEVESFLLTHPLLHAVAVTSEADELIGERIVAYVQPAMGKEVTTGDLIRYCKGRLSAYKLPDTFIITDELPKDIGKIQFKYITSPPASPLRPARGK